mmetsp:Transcript_21976/g.54154  ORF Transcript_21976/g.54154 Transcript_21976/m.54154 type:complete len:249 (-) Transcript_21976:1666-2412(-)
MVEAPDEDVDERVPLPLSETLLEPILALLHPIALGWLVVCHLIQDALKVVVLVPPPADVISQLTVRVRPHAKPRNHLLPHALAVRVPKARTLAHDSTEEHQKVFGDRGHKRRGDVRPRRLRRVPVTVRVPRGREAEERHEVEAVQERQKKGVRTNEHGGALQVKEVEIEAKVIKVAAPVEPRTPQHRLPVPTPDPSPDLRQQDLDPEGVLHHIEDELTARKDTSEEVSAHKPAQLREEEAHKAVHGYV